MFAFIISFIIGVVCIIIGILNTRGNISTLHSYHTHRVTEEDRIPFGKKVGLGTIIIGCSVITHSILATITLYLKFEIFIIIGNICLGLGLVLGAVIALCAIKKYNKGIF